MTITWADISNGDTSDFVIDGTPQESRPTSVTALQTVSFKVVPEEGFKVASVKVNDVAVEADGDGPYSVKVKENITITVAIIDQNEEVAQEYNKTFVIADIAKNESWKNATQYTKLPTGDANLSITVEGGGDDGKLYGGDNWRVYKSGSGKLVISVVSGYELVSVTVTFDSDKRLQ